MGNSVGNWEEVGKRLTARGKAPFEDKRSKALTRVTYINYQVEEDEYLYDQGSLSYEHETGSGDEY